MNDDTRRQRFGMDFLTGVIVFCMAIVVMSEIKAGFYAWLKVAYIPTETKKYDLHMHYNFGNFHDLGDDPVRPDHPEPLAGDSV